MGKEHDDGWNTGAQFHDKGEYDKALELYLFALEENKHPVLYTNIALVHARMGNEQDASDYFEKAYATLAADEKLYYSCSGNALNNIVWHYHDVKKDNKASLH